MTCQYILKRGKNKGMECGEDIYNNTCYCSKHIKVIEKNTVFDDLIDSVIKVNFEVGNKGLLDFYENEVGRFINNNKYVINCPEERVVIGRLDKIGELNSLTIEDMDWCIENNLRYERFI